MQERKAWMAAEGLESESSDERDSALTPVSAIGSEGLDSFDEDIISVVFCLFVCGRLIAHISHIVLCACSCCI